MLPFEQTRVRLTGDEALAQTYIGSARRLLFQVRQIVKASGVPVYALTQELDGVVIYAGYFGGMTEIRVDVSQHVGTQTTTKLPVPVTPVRGILFADTGDYQAITLKKFPPTWGNADPPGIDGLTLDPADSQYITGPWVDDILTISMRNARYLADVYKNPKFSSGRFLRLPGGEGASQSIVPVVDWLRYNATNIGAYQRDPETRFAWSLGESAPRTAVLLGGVPVIWFDGSGTQQRGIKALHVTKKHVVFMVTAGDSAAEVVEFFAVPRSTLPVNIVADNKADYLIGTLDLSIPGAGHSGGFHTVVPHPTEPRFAIAMTTPKVESDIGNRGRSTMDAPNAWMLEPDERVYFTEMQSSTVLKRIEEWDRAVEVTVLVDDPLPGQPEVPVSGSVSITYDKVYSVVAEDVATSTTTVAITTTYEVHKATDDDPVGSPTPFPWWEKKGVSLNASQTAWSYSFDVTSLHSVTYVNGQLTVWEIRHWGTVGGGVATSEAYMLHRYDKADAASDWLAKLDELSGSHTASAGTYTRQLELSAVTGAPPPVTVLGEDLPGGAISRLVGIPSYKGEVVYAEMTGQGETIELNPTDLPRTYMRGVWGDLFLPDYITYADHPEQAAELWPRLSRRDTSQYEATQTIVGAQGDIGGPTQTSDTTYEKTTFHPQDGFFGNRRHRIWLQGADDQTFVWEESAQVAGLYNEATMATLTEYAHARYGGRGADLASPVFAEMRYGDNVQLAGNKYFIHDISSGETFFIIDKSVTGNQRIFLLRGGAITEETSDGRLGADTSIEWSLGHLL